MRVTFLFLLLLHVPLYACPDAGEAANAWAQENFGGDEENPLVVQKRVTRLNPMVSAVQITLPADPDDQETGPKIVTAFFTGANCEFAQQFDGEIADSIEVGATKYLFIRTEVVDAEERQVNYQPVTVQSSGEIGYTRDQHGSEIQFAQSLQQRCEGKVGQMATWQRDKNDNRLLIVTERQSDRDEKCRLIQDSSTFRYYRLTDDIWRLDDGDSEAETTTTAKRKP